MAKEEKNLGRKLYYPQDLWNFIKSIVPTILFILLIRTVVFEPSKIPSGSMIPTLLVGDHLIISKFMYGISKYSCIYGYKYNYFNGRAFFFKKPKTGDVVVFALPSDPSIIYIKRCIGLPGDKIQMKDGYLYINGKKTELVKKSKDYLANDGEENISGTIYTQTLPNGYKHSILKQKPFGEGIGDNTPEYIVPEKSYFMMGDNRDGSADSRFMDGLGFVHEDYLIGPAWMLFFSIDQGFSVMQPWNWYWHIRYGRMGKMII